MSDPTLVEFDRLSPYISSALGYTGGTHTLDDVREMVADGRLQLWPSADSFILTEILQYPRQRIVNLFLAGGSLENGSRDIYPVVMDWAREQGCSRATFAGRPGWARTFLTREEGWSAPLVLFERDL